MYEFNAGARGQRTLKGSPQRIADEMEEWFLKRGVDGFVVQPAYLPGGFKDFAELVVPEAGPPRPVPRRVRRQVATRKSRPAATAMSLR